MKFDIEQEAYAGPFPVLLELLDKKELTISNVSLARIAEDFGRYLNTHEVHNEELADFLLVSSRLIYLKTKELLPYLEIAEEEAEVDLAEQIRIYQHFVEYAQKIRTLYESQEGLFERPFNTKLVDRKFAPSILRLDEVHKSFLGVIKKNEPFFLLRQATMERVETVKERIERLTDMIKTKARFGFRELTAKSGSRADIIVSFLALLELVKSRLVRATQGEDHDIMIERI